MTVPRIDEATDVVVGRFYLVPTVRAQWYDTVRDWPIIGPKHRDKDCFHFDDLHYHFDHRFIAEPNVSDRKWFWTRVQGAPLMTSPRINPDGLPEPVWKRIKCKRLESPFAAEVLRQQMSLRSRTGMRCLAEAWAGKQARHDGRGWVCPHRQVPLAGIPAHNGVILCPAHLLRIDASTGKVLPPSGEAA